MNEKKILSIEAMPYVQLEQLKAERLKIEAIPEPEKKTLFQQEIADFKESLQSELKQGITNIVAQSARNIQDNLSLDLLLEQAKQVYRKEAIKLSTPYLMLVYIDQLQEALEYEARSWDMSQWQNRFKGIDAQIKQWTAKVPKPFSPDMINTETMGPLVYGSKELRFPADRVGMADGKYYDRWLTDILKSKPVFFEPQERYQESLKEFYTRIYLPETAKEQETASKQALAQEKTEKTAQPEPVEDTYRIPDNELKLLHEQDAERSILWQGSRRR